MKMKKVVTMNYKHAHCSYNGIEFDDPDGNEIVIIMSENDYIELSNLLESKKRSIERKRLQELEEKLDALKKEEEND
tara:strand:- start:284 stop:514 length:231 start_codon:yes stop_codon:yes gene_type:complete